MSDDILQFEDGGAAKRAEAVPWGLMAWTWAAVLIVPPLGMVVSVVALALMWRSRRFVTGLWVLVAGLFTAMALTVTIGLYLLHGMEVEARQNAQYRECRANVEALAGVLAAFIAEEGRAPASLDEIAARLPGGVIQRCPAHSGEGHGYIYVPGNYREGEGYRIILYDSEPRHNGCRVICRQDGRVEWFAEATFQQLLSNPADQIREAMRRRRERDGD